jgi:hypothetical protein
MAFFLFDETSSPFSSPFSSPGEFNFRGIDSISSTALSMKTEIQRQQGKFGEKISISVSKS